MLKQRTWQYAYTGKWYDIGKNLNPLCTYVQSISNQLDFGRIGHAEEALFRNTFLTHSMCFNTDTQNIHPWGVRHSHPELKKMQNDVSLLKSYLHLAGSIHLLSYATPCQFQ